MLADERLRINEYTWLVKGFYEATITIITTTIIIITIITTILLLIIIIIIIITNTLRNSIRQQ